MNPLNNLVATHSPPKQSKMSEFMDDTFSSSSLKNTNYIDKITMECMMNKKHYKTYLEKTNPTRLRESRNLQNKIIRNSIHIENIFEELLETSKKFIKGQNRRYNNKIQHAFYEFIEHSLQYIENEQEDEADPTPEEIIQKELMRDYGEEVEEETRTEKNYFCTKKTHGIIDNKLVSDVTVEVERTTGANSVSDDLIFRNEIEENQGKCDVTTENSVSMSSQDIARDSPSNITLFSNSTKEKNKSSSNKHKNYRRLESFPSNYFL